MDFAASLIGRNKSKKEQKNCRFISWKVRVHSDKNKLKGNGAPKKDPGTATDLLY